MRRFYKVTSWDPITECGKATDGTYWDAQPIEFLVYGRDLTEDLEDHLNPGETISAEESPSRVLYDVLIEDGARAAARPVDPYKPAPGPIVTDTEVESIVAGTLTVDEQIAAAGTRTTLVTVGSLIENWKSYPEHHTVTIKPYVPLATVKPSDTESSDPEVRERARAILDENTRAVFVVPDQVGDTIEVPNTNVVFRAHSRPDEEDAIIREWGGTNEVDADLRVQEQTEKDEMMQIPFDEWKDEDVNRHVRREMLKSLPVVKQYLERLEADLTNGVPSPPVFLSGLNEARPNPKPLGSVPSLAEIATPFLSMAQIVEKFRQLEQRIHILEENERRAFLDKHNLDKYNLDSGLPF